MGLGDLVLDTFKKVVDYIVELAEDFADIIKRGILMIIQHIEEETKPDIEKLIPSDLFEYPYYKGLKEYVEKEAGKKPVPLLAIAGMIGGSVVGTGVGLGLGGFGRDISNFFNSWRRPTPLDIPILAYANHTNQLSEEKINTNYANLGYADDYKDVLFNYYKPKLTITELLTAEKRIDKLDYDIDDALKSHGYNDTEISILRELSWYYPSPTD
ncbi:MAG: hypothetical protein DRJ03_28420, partial [Chloroflexi bacterium]